VDLFDRKLDKRFWNSTLLIPHKKTVMEADPTSLY